MVLSCRTSLLHSVQGVVHSLTLHQPRAPNFGHPQSNSWLRNILACARANCCLSHPQQRRCPHRVDRKYLAIMRGLEHWDCLLCGPKDEDKLTIVITDHANLQYYRHPHKIGPQVAGYIGKREEYPIKLMYKPGKTNRADALS